MSLRPLREDPATHELLRRDLEEAARAPHVPFDLEAATARFEAALPLVPLASGTSVGASAGAGQGFLAKAVSAIWGWKGAVAGLVLAGSGVWLAVPAPRQAPAPDIGQVEGPPSLARPASPSSAPVPLPAPVPAQTAPPLPPSAQAPRLRRRPVQPPVAPPRPSVEDAAPAGAVASAVEDAAPVGTAGSAFPGEEVSAAQPPVQHVPPRASNPAGTLAQEVAQLAEVKALLEVDPARALALAQRGHDLFAEGALYEEREAMALLALGRLGQSDALRVRAERFLSRYPTSAFHERIRGLLKP